MNGNYKVRLVNLVELEQGAKLVTVEVTKTIPHWYGDSVISYGTTFQYVDGIWIGENGLVVSELSLSYALQEQLVSKLAETQLDNYIATP